MTPEKCNPCYFLSDEARGEVPYCRRYFRKIDTIDLCEGGPFSTQRVVDELVDDDMAKYIYWWVLAHQETGHTVVAMNKGQFRSFRRRDFIGVHELVRILPKI